jgi:hypothetical protein
MNEEQCNRIAADFVRALGEQEELRDQWAVFARDRDWKGLRELIAGTLDLEHTPTHEDLEKMHEYAEHHLSRKCKEIEELDKRIDAIYIFNGRGGHPGG